MKATTKSNRNLIMLVAGLVILLLVYFLFFVKTQDKTDEIKSELSTRQTYLDELEACYANEASYLEGIDESKQIVTELTAKLPADVKTEDFLLYLLDLENATGIHISDVAIDEKEAVTEFDCVVDDETKTMSGDSVDASVVAQMNYEQLKSVLNYIYASKDTTYLDTMSVAYDNGTAELGVSMDLTKLCLDYDGAEYNAPLMPSVATGLDDLFKTGVSEVELADGEDAADTEAVEEENAAD